MALRPHLGLARLNLAMALSDQGRNVEAVAVIREGLRLMPGDPRLLSEYGFILVRQDKHDEAVAVHRELIGLHPDSAAAHIALGCSLWAQGLWASATLAIQTATWDAAAAEFRAAIRLWPNSALAHLCLGEIMRLQNKVDLAISESREAIRLQPEFALAHTILGFALARQGKLDEAVAEGREAIRISSDAYQHHILGEALEKQGKLDEAMAECREAIRLHPEFPWSHTALGEALKAKGDLDGAIAEFRETLRVRPGYLRARPPPGFSTNEDAPCGPRATSTAPSPRSKTRFGSVRTAKHSISLMAILKAKKNPVDGMAFFDSLIRDQPLEATLLARTGPLPRRARAVGRGRG